MDDGSDWTDLLGSALRAVGGYISDFTKKFTLSAILKDVDKSVRTATGIKDYLTERKELQSRRDMATHLSNILLDLRFEETGIRGKLRVLLLNPSGEAAKNLDRELNKRLGVVKKTIGYARSDENFAARHSDLIDKVMTSIQDKKIEFYAAMLTKQAEFSRYLDRYLKNPGSVSLGKRQKIMVDLDAFFDHINSEISATRKEIQDFLEKTE